VLEAVQGRKKVASILLGNATVDSLADGVLTLAFAQAGTAKGFLTGGYDKDLVAVLTAMFGITPHVRTALLANGGGHSQDRELETGTGPPGPRPPRPAAAAGAEPPGPRPVPPRRPRPPEPDPGDVPDPGDRPAPDNLTGMDLIERELGGRVIAETDVP
jgi:hypothetical protein